MKENIKQKQKMYVRTLIRGIPWKYSQHFIHFSLNFIILIIKDDDNNSISSECYNKNLYK